MRALRLVFAVGLSGLAAAQQAASPGPPVVRAMQHAGRQQGGDALQPLAPAGSRAVVLFFVATDCPVSNRMFPEMKRLREEFASRGVRTWFVYPNEGEKPAVVQAHQQEFDPGGDVWLDRQGSLVRLVHAVATPEIAVLAPDRQAGWRPVYAGRIDNRYVRLGLERPEATGHFGEDAIEAVLAGRTPEAPAGPPVGCAIVNRAAR